MEGSAVTDPVPAVEEPEITSPATTGPRRAEPAATDDSGGGDDSAASCLWSLTHEQQVHNFKENWRSALDLTMEWIYIEDKFETNPWFASVVEKLRVDPCLDSCKFEIDASLTRGLIKSGLTMTSLDVAILMGDLNMVRKILERSSVLDELIHGSLMDLQRALQDLQDFRVYKKIGFFNTPLYKKIDFLYTPLHLAVVGGNTEIMEVLLKKGVDVNAQNWLNRRPLDFASKMGRYDMLRELLAEDNERKDLLHVIVQHGDVDFMRNLPFRNVNALDYRGRTPLHILASTSYVQFDVMTNIIKCLAEDGALDTKALDFDNLSAFYVAVLRCNTEFVIALLDSFKDKIRLNEICDEDLGPPIQIAVEGGHSFKDIERALMECEPVKGYMERLYRDRQVYVDAANAILVGAALIASVTFASWLQPPLNYTSYFGEGYSSSDPTPSTSNLNYVDVEHNIALRAFWVFNALSFYFAIATVVCGARSVLPRSHLFIKKTVEKLRTNLLMTSMLLACSVLFVIVAFAIAGTIVLTPLVKYQWYMIVPTLVGGMVCLISLVFLVKSMREIYSNTHEKYRYLLHSKGRDYLEQRGYILPPEEIIG